MFSVLVKRLFWLGETFRETADREDLQEAWILDRLDLSGVSLFEPIGRDEWGEKIGGRRWARPHATHARSVAVAETCSSGADDNCSLEDISILALVRESRVVFRICPSVKDPEQTLAVVTSAFRKADYPVDSEWEILPLQVIWNIFERARAVTEADLPSWANTALVEGILDVCNRPRVSLYTPDFAIFCQEEAYGPVEVESDIHDSPIVVVHCVQTDDRSP